MSILSQLSSSYLTGSPVGIYLVVRPIRLCWKRQCAKRRSGDDTLSAEMETAWLLRFGCVASFGKMKE